MSYEKLFSLEDKKVVFTGGAGYLGSKIVEGMLDNGAIVYVADWKKDRVSGRFDRSICVPCLRCLTICNGNQYYG